MAHGIAALDAGIAILVTLRAFRMFENVKEWTFLMLPLVWVFAIYGSDLPYATESIMDGIILGSTGLYMLGNYWYIQGYISAPENRIKGFTLRRRVSEFWMLGSFVSIVWAGLVRFGVIWAQNDKIRFSIFLNSSRELLLQLQIAYVVFSRG